MVCFMKNREISIHYYMIGFSLTAWLQPPLQAASNLPPLAEPGEGALLRAEQIFPIVGKPTMESHASTIVETQSGLVAARFDGNRERNPDVGIWLSRNEQGKWSKLEATALPNAGNDAVTLKDGRQLMIYNHTTKDSMPGFPAGRRMIHVATSLDGRDWTPVLTMGKEMKGVPESRDSHKD